MRPALIDTVAWVCLENGRILCARPRGKDVFYITGGKREGAETDLQTLLREVTEELTVTLRPETVRHVGTYAAAQPGGALTHVLTQEIGVAATPWPAGPRVTRRGARCRG